MADEPMMPFYLTVARKPEFLRFVVQDLAGDHHAHNVVQIVAKFLAAMMPMPAASRPPCMVCGQLSPAKFNPAAIVCLTPAALEGKAGEPETINVPSGWLCADCSDKGDAALVAALAQWFPGMRLPHGGTETVQ